MPKRFLEVSRLRASYPAPPPVIGWLMGKGRESTSVLDGVDFVQQAGESVSLLGRNGAGKSTLLKILLGLLPPEGGTVLVDGVEASSLESRRRLGFVHPDERSFYHRLNVRDNLRFFGGLWGIERQRLERRIDALAASLECSRWLHRPFQVLSTGMRQKVALVRALLHDPEMVLMDEPTRSLDRIAASQVHGFIRGLVEEGRGLFVATHSLEEASALSDRCLVLCSGNLVHDGGIPDPETLGRQLGGAP